MRNSQGKSASPSSDEEGGPLAVEGEMINNYPSVIFQNDSSPDKWSLPQHRARLMCSSVFICFCEICGTTHRSFPTIKYNILAERDAEGNKQSVKESSEFKRIAKENELTEIHFSGDNIKDLETLYAKMRNIDPKDIEAGLKGNAEMLAKEIAKM